MSNPERLDGTLSRPRTSLLALSAAALTMAGGSLLVLVADGLDGDGTSLGFSALAPLLVGHLWASRWRVLLSLVLTVAPGLLVAAAVITTARSEDGPTAGLVLVAVAAVLTLLTASVAAWVGHRLGRRARFCLDDLGHMPP